MATIRTAVEQALVAYLQAQELGVTVAGGLSASDKAAPIAVVTCKEWAEDEAYLNWYRLRVAVEVKAVSTYGETAFDSLCAAVRDALRLSDLGTVLNSGQSAVTFAEQGISAEDQGEFTIQDDVWIETRNVELYATLTTSE